MIFLGIHQANHCFWVLLKDFDDLKRTESEEPFKTNQACLSAPISEPSPKKQDATRARAALETFAEECGLSVAAWYVENGSGASLKRPELSDCKADDVLLIEQVERLSHLNDTDWEALKREIGARGVRIVALDLPTSW